jgi:hypothetical protein
MEIKVTITRTVDDIKKAYKLHYHKTSRQSTYILIMLLVGGIVIFFSEGAGHDPFDKALISFFMIFISAVLLWARYNIANRSAKLYPNLLQEQSVFISPFKLEFETKHSQTMMTWDIFTDALISDEVILLYLNKIQFIILPARCFSEEQYAFLKGKAGQYAKPTTTRYRKM